MAAFGEMRRAFIPRIEISSEGGEADEGRIAGGSAGSVVLASATAANSSTSRTVSRLKVMTCRIR
jgi:hypothetical protein